MSEEQMATLGKDLDSIEVSYLTPVISEKGRTLKKTVLRKGVLLLSSILIMDENFDSKGNLVEGTCRVYYENLGWLVLEEDYDEMAKYKMGQANTVIGFQPTIKKQKNDTRTNPRKNA